MPNKKAGSDIKRIWSSSEHASLYMILILEVVNFAKFCCLFPYKLLPPQSCSSAYIFFSPFLYFTVRLNELFTRSLILVTSLGTSVMLPYIEPISSVCGYTVLIFNQATQANSAWPSLRLSCSLGYQVTVYSGYSGKLLIFKVYA